MPKALGGEDVGMWIEFSALGDSEEDLQLEGRKERRTASDRSSGSTEDERAWPTTSEGR